MIVPSMMSVINFMQLNCHLRNEAARISQKDAVFCVVVVCSFLFHGHDEQVGDSDRCLQKQVRNAMNALIYWLVRVAYIHTTGGKT